MDIQQIVAVLTALVTLLTNGYDLWLKFKKRKRGPLGSFSGRLNTLLFAVAALAIGWIGGFYSREAMVSHLLQQVSDLNQQKNQLALDREMNIRVRDKALRFFQYQMQVSADEFDRLSGRSNKSRNESVILFEHVGFEGQRLFFPIGQYPDLHSYWFGDKTSSIRLIGKVEAIAYEDTNYGGRELYIHNDVPSLESLNAHWNDRISSIKVFKK